MARDSDNEPVPGALLSESNPACLYFNAEHVRDTIAARLRTEATPPKIVVLDLSASPHMDIQACGVVMNMADDIKAVGARLQNCRGSFFCARPPARGGNR